jgi:hypothetical protein
MPARQGPHFREPVVEPPQAHGIGFDAIAIVLQRRLDVAELDLDAAECRGWRVQRVVDCGELVDLAPRLHYGGVSAGRVAVREGDQGRAHTAQQPVGVGEPLALGSQSRGLAGCQRQRFELGDLEPQELDFGLLLHACAAPLLELRCEGLQRAELLGDRRGERSEAAVGIEQRTLAAGLEQRLMSVLAVDVDEQATEALEVLQVDRLAVDEGPRSTVFAEHAA